MREFSSSELAWIEEANNKAIVAGKAGDLLLAREILKGNKMASGKGRPKKLEENAQDLLDAITFISVAGTKDISPFNSHVQFTNGWAIMSDGQISAGYPISIDTLDCCPHYKKLKVALAKVGKSLAMTQNASSLSIKGDTIRAVVPCLPKDQMPELEWDDAIANCNDTLKEAFKVCGILTDENATDVIEASICMQAYVCSATDRKAIIQKQHDNSLPTVILPKIFTNAVGKTKLPIVGFGWTEGRSITLHFEGGAWIKTLVYVDPWPIESLSPILDRQSSATPINPGLLEAIATVATFKKDDDAHNIIVLKDGIIQSNLSAEIGAQVDLQGFEGRDKQVNPEQFKAIGSFITHIDTTSYPDVVFFFGDKMRGVMSCYINSLES